MIVAAVALTFALAGTALAGPTVSKLTKSKVRAIASKEIDKQEAGLSVLNAKTATTATTVAANGVGGGALKAVTRVQATSAPFASATAGSAFVQCPAGSRVLSGGGEASVPNVFATLSRASSPNGWRYDGWNNTGVNQTVTVYAYCLDA